MIFVILHFDISSSLKKKNLPFSQKVAAGPGLSWPERSPQVRSPPAPWEVLAPWQSPLAQAESALKSVALFIRAACHLVTCLLQQLGGGRVREGRVGVKVTSRWELHTSGRSLPLVIILPE